LTIMRVAPQQQQLPQSLLASGPVAPAPPLTFPQGVVPAARRQSGSFPGPAPLVAAELLSEADEGVPDALGLSAREALALFARRGLSVSLQGKGFVVSQQPSAGVRVRPGEASRLYLSEVAAPSGRSRRGHEESSFTPPSP